MKRNLEDVVNTLNKLISDSEKLRTLRHQYGIASRRIHELKAANALLREQLKELKDNPSVSVQTFNNPLVEPDKSLTLQSSRLDEHGNRFLLKFGMLEDWQEEGLWWRIENGRSLTWSNWDYWVEHYGPFTVVS